MGSCNWLGRTRDGLWTWAAARSHDHSFYGLWWWWQRFWTVPQNITLFHLLNPLCLTLCWPSSPSHGLSVSLPVQVLFFLGVEETIPIKSITLKRKIIRGGNVVAFLLSWVDWDVAVPKWFDALVRSPIDMKSWMSMEHSNFRRTIKNLWSNAQQMYSSCLPSTLPSALPFAFRFALPLHRKKDAVLLVFFVFCFPTPNMPWRTKTNRVFWSIGWNLRYRSDWCFL